MRRKDFLEACTLCGGDWTRMFLTGIKALDPELWESLPDIVYEFDDVSFVANNMCSDTPHYQFNMNMCGRVLKRNADGSYSVFEVPDYVKRLTVSEFDEIFNRIRYDSGSDKVVTSFPKYCFVAENVNGKPCKFVSAHPALSLAKKGLSKASEESEFDVAIFVSDGEEVSLLSESDNTTANKLNLDG